MSRKTKKSDEGKFWTLRGSKSKGYKKPTFDVAKTFLIVCEGKNTEPKYFESFPVVTADIKTEGGLGSRTALVKAAIKLKQNEVYKGREVWCVFDYDHKPDNVTIEGDFNEATALAKSKDIKVAFSNDSFELWFILHYQYHDAQVTRSEFYKSLRVLWGLEESYEEMGKRQDFCNNIYGMLLPYQQTAIENAKKLYQIHNDGKPYAKFNPCTTVFLLVEELNKFLKK